MSGIISGWALHESIHPRIACIRASISFEVSVDELSA